MTYDSINTPVDMRARVEDAEDEGTYIGFETVDIKRRHAPVLPSE